MKKTFASVLLSCVVMTPAFAADSGPFVALDAQSWSATNVAPFGNPSAGLRIGGGYRFTRNIGMEVDYAKSGDATLGNAKLNVNSIQAVAVGTYPINNLFDVYGKLGLASNKVSVSGPGNTSCTQCSKTNPMFGVGGQYNVNKQFGIRLEYDQLGKASDWGSDNIGVTTLSAGVVYSF